MITARKAGIGMAALFGAILVTPALADGASDFIANTQKAQTTLDQIATLIDNIHTHASPGNASAAEPGTQQVAATEEMKCPVCGMMMTVKATDANTKAVTIKGKTYYCCAGCDMSKVADKPARARRNGQRRRNP